MDFTLGHLEFKKFRKRAEEIFFCVLSACLCRGSAASELLCAKGQLSWTDPVNLGGERGTLSLVAGNLLFIISQNSKVCASLQREQGCKSSITFIRKHLSSASFLLNSIEVLRPFLLFSPVYFANPHGFQIIFFLPLQDSSSP